MAGVTGFSDFDTTLDTAFFATGLATGFAFCGFVLADFFNATVLCATLAGGRVFGFALWAFADFADFVGFFAVFTTGARS